MVDTQTRMMKKTFTKVIFLFVCLAHTTGLCFTSYSPDFLTKKNYTLKADSCVNNGNVTNHLDGAAVASSGANNAMNGVRLNAQLAGQEIAGGHALAKHASELGVTTSAQLAARVEQIIMNPSEVRYLSGGRIAYWDNVSQTVVIRNPSAVDGGTIFKPVKGKVYFMEDLQ